MLFHKRCLIARASYFTSHDACAEREEKDVHLEGNEEALYAKDHDKGAGDAFGEHKEERLEENTENEFALVKDGRQTIDRLIAKMFDRYGVSQLQATRFD